MCSAPRRRTVDRLNYALPLLLVFIGAALLSSNLPAQTPSEPGPQSADSATASMPARHLPVGYVTPEFSIGPGLDRAVYVIGVRLEAPVNPSLRTWIGAGLWGIPGPDCWDSCRSDSGVQLEAGLDAVTLPASSPLRGYFGAGIGWRGHDQAPAMVAPIGRAGFDIQPWPWVAPRAGIEVTRYPTDGWKVLFSAGVRLGIPGGFAGATPP